MTTEKSTEDMIQELLLKLNQNNHDERMLARVIASTSDREEDRKRLEMIYHKLMNQTEE